MERRGDEIEETPEEARAGVDDPGMVWMLRISVALAIVGLGVLFLFFYGRSAGWFH